MRWLKFNAVGAIGGMVQLGLLALFIRVLKMNYLAASAMAVEITVLHNFIWHRQWTWADRRNATEHPVRVLLRFNLTNGLVSICGNLLACFLLTGLWSVDPLIANAASIALGSVANLLLSDRLVFTQSDLERSGLPDRNCRG